MGDIYQGSNDCDHAKSIIFWYDRLGSEPNEGEVSDEQLDTIIRTKDTDALGRVFHSVSALLTKLSLKPAEVTIVNKTADKKGTQAGIAHALRLWRNANPSKATYRTLLEIAESLKRDTISQICKFYHNTMILLKLSHTNYKYILLWKLYTTALDTLHVPKWKKVYAHN